MVQKILDINLLLRMRMTSHRVMKKQTKKDTLL